MANLKRTKSHIQPRDNVVPTELLVAILFVVIFLVPFAWWAFSTWQILSMSPPDNRIPRQIELLKTVAQFVLGAAVVVTLVFTQRRVRAAERTVEVAQEGQITERFTRAIEQLGNRGSLAIRLGGIFALERIAQDSKKDHWQVMEVLTAYVREKSAYDEHMPSIQPVTTDIQDTLTVLGRRKAEYDKPGGRLDLSRTHLQGVRLADANLQHATFTGANLGQAVFYRVNFDGAVFQSAVLQGANFEKSTLTRTYFQRATLLATKIQGADIRNADLSEASYLEHEQVDSAIFDETTKLPPDL